MTEMFRLTDEFKSAALRARYAAPSSVSVYGIPPGGSMHPIFGALIERDTVNSRAKFLHPETRDPGGPGGFMETDVSVEMIEEMLKALIEMGALNTDARDGIQLLLDEFSATVKPVGSPFDLLAAGPEPQRSEQDIAVDLLVDTVRNAEDSFAEAGKWITKVTNGITEVLKEV